MSPGARKMLPPCMQRNAANEIGHPTRRISWMGGVSHGRRDAAAADVCILPDRPGDRRDQADRQGSSGGSGEDEQAPEREYERLLHPAYGRVRPSGGVT